MNMTSFYNTLSGSAMKTKCFQTMKWGLAIALTGLLSGDTEVQAQGPQSIQHNGNSFSVVQASDALGMMSIPQESAPLSNLDETIQQVGFCGGNCGSKGCDGGCDGSGTGCGSAGSCGGGSCGGGSCGGSSYGAGSSCNYGGGGCMECPTCDPYRYARVEAVYMRREDIDNFTRSQLFDLDEYDFEWAPRVTFGCVPDCVNGTEISFTGPLNWDTSNSLANGNGRTFLTENNAAVTPDAGFVFLFDPADLGDSADDPINFQRQQYESTYYTVEMSQTMLAWDIAKFSFGGRYISFEEDYSYTASNGAAAVDNGFIASSTTNDMIGLQVGLEIFTPVCNHISSFMKAKGGLYYNLADSQAVVQDQGELLYRSNDDDGTFAGMFELSNGIQAQLSEMLSVQAGTELWYITEVATAGDQIPSLVGTSVGRRGIDTSDDVLFLGFSFGATLKF